MGDTPPRTFNPPRSQRAMTAGYAVGAAQPSQRLPGNQYANLIPEVPYIASPQNSAPMASGDMGGGGGDGPRGGWRNWNNGWLWGSPPFQV